MLSREKGLSLSLCEVRRCSWVPQTPGVNSHWADRAPSKSLPGNFHDRHLITSVNLLHLSLSASHLHIFPFILQQKYQL